MYYHRKRGFMLIIVMILFSLAALAEMLATRHLVNLRKHVHERQEIVQSRVSVEK